MINPSILEADKNTSNHGLRHHPHPRVRQRMGVLWVKRIGVCHQEIFRLANMSSTTVTQYLKAYQARGLDALKALNFRRPKSELESFRGTLKADFEQNPPTGI